MDHFAIAYPVFSRIRGSYSRRFQDMLESLRRFSGSKVAKERLRIIKFYEKYGENALRRSKILEEIINFIKAMREKYPRIGKEKLKPLLDKYCAKKNLKTISEATIGNIIKRHNLFYQKTGRIYHDPNSKWADNSAKRQRRSKIKYPIKPKDFGHIVSDTVQTVIDGIKEYFISAIDAKLKFALTVNYKRFSHRFVTFNSFQYYCHFFFCCPFDTFGLPPQENASHFLCFIYTAPS